MVLMTMIIKNIIHNHAKVGVNLKAKINTIIHVYFILIIILYIISYILQVVDNGINQQK